MTVAELIKELEECPQDSLVMLSADDEGNEYRDMYQVSTAVWSEGQEKLCVSRELTKELEDQGYGDEDCCDDEHDIDVVVFY